MKKRCLVLMIIFFCWSSMVPVVWAADTVVPNTLEDGRPFEVPFVLSIESLQLDRHELETEQCPLLIDGENVLLPIRVIGEELGWYVSWNDENQIITLTNSEDTYVNNHEEITITIKIGDKIVEEDVGDYFNATVKPDEYYHNTLELPVVPYLVNGVAMVPQEVICEYMRCSVQMSFYDQRVFVDKINPIREVP